MWIKDFGWPKWIDKWDIDARKENLRKRNANDYLAILENEVNAKLNDASLSPQEKKVLSNYFTKATRVVQAHNIKRFETKNWVKSALKLGPKPKEWYTLQHARKMYGRDKFPKGHKLLLKAEDAYLKVSRPRNRTDQRAEIDIKKSKQYYTLKYAQDTYKRDDPRRINAENAYKDLWKSQKEKGFYVKSVGLWYTNDNNFGQELIWRPSGNDNWDTWAAETHVEWQMSSGRSYEVKTWSTVYTNNVEKTRAESHQFQLGEVIDSEYSRLAYGWVIWTTHWDIWNKAQATIHEMTDYIDRSQYAHDKDKWNWIWAYLDYSKEIPLLWNKDNWIQWYYWAWGQIWTSYVKSEVYWKVWVKWRKSLPFGTYIRWDLSLNAKYHINDPKWETIQWAYDWDTSTYGKLDLEVGKRFFWGDLGVYASVTQWNHLRDWGIPEWGREKEDASFAAWLRWRKTF